MSAPVTGHTTSGAGFFTGPYYGKATEKGDAFYFSVCRKTGGLYNDKVSGYVNAETFDLLAQQFGLPLLRTVQQRDSSDDEMLKRAMERFQRALHRVRDGTYKTPAWIAEHARELDKHFDPSGHVFVPHTEDDRCAVCAQPKQGHLSDDEVSHGS